MLTRLETTISSIDQNEVLTKNTNYQEILNNLKNAISNSNLEDTQQYLAQLLKEPVYSIEPTRTGPDSDLYTLKATSSYKHKKFFNNEYWTIDSHTELNLEKSHQFTRCDDIRSCINQAILLAQKEARRSGPLDDHSPIVGILECLHKEMTSNEEFRNDTWKATDREDARTIASLGNLKLYNLFHIEQPTYTVMSRDERTLMQEALSLPANTVLLECIMHEGVKEFVNNQNKNPTRVQLFYRDVEFMAFQIDCWVKKLYNAATSYSLSKTLGALSDVGIFSRLSERRDLLEKGKTSEIQQQKPEDRLKDKVNTITSPLITNDSTRILNVNSKEISSIDPEKGRELASNKPKIKKE
jgi:hypothetical protein